MYCPLFFSDFDDLENTTVNIRFPHNASWVILSPIEQRIKEKIEKVGVPLKDWDIQINYGIKTGCNEAFIIDKAKRDELIRQSLNSVDIIRPILRGKDIKKYGYSFAELYLLFIPWHFPLHNNKDIVGASQEAEKIFQQEYPAIYDHLLQYKTQLSNRNKAETGIRYEWYALQRFGSNYMDDFNKQKVVWKRVGSILRFAFDDKKLAVLDSTCFAAGNYAKYLTGILNSNMGKYMLQESPTTGTGDLLISVQAIEPLKIPIPNMTTKKLIEDKVDKILQYNTDCDIDINPDIYSMYALSNEEITFIETFLTAPTK
ncbi:class I SAM-dependent DNA methyltransferase [Treponema parvum]|nr:class I SAM-dependent DNA methyltransferase [Treponema parvum]